MRAFFLSVSKGFSEAIRLSETGLWPEIGLRTPRVSFHPPFTQIETHSKKNVFLDACQKWIAPQLRSVRPLSKQTETLEGGVDVRDDAGLLTRSACGFRWLSSSGSGRMQCRARTSTKHMKMYFKSEPFGAMRPILFVHSVYGVSLGRTFMAGPFRPFCWTQDGGTKAAASRRRVGRRVGRKE